MKLPIQIDRPLIFFDLETTGLSVSKDRIVELALIRISPQGDVLEKVRRFNPEMPIPAEAQAVHGISDEEVKDEEPFSRRARALADMLEGCDLAGFNIRKYDLPMLEAEFLRAGVDFDVSGRRLIDVQNIFHREERRDLTAAARFYLGRDHEEAHTALGDIRTTAAVLSAQMEQYEHLPREIDALNQYCNDFAPYRSGLEKWFRETEEGLWFNRGKYKERPLPEIARTDTGYLDWICGLDDTHPRVIKVIREEIEKQRLPGTDEA